MNFNQYTEDDISAIIERRDEDWRSIMWAMGTGCLLMGFGLGVIVILLKRIITGE